jgi:hypothetical protein
MADRQKQLKAFLQRRHPRYAEMAPQWCFMQETYAGGRCWFEKNLFKYLKEGDAEFKDRKGRAYRFNHTREVVDLVDKHLFKQTIARREEDAPASVKDFWRKSTLNGLAIKDFVKRVSNLTSQNGRVWIVVDSNRTAEIKTRKQEKEAGIQVYAYTVLPQYVLDMGYGSVGDLEWILIQENVRDDKDPIIASGAVVPRFRLWTKKFSQLFEVKGDLNSDKWVIIENTPVNHSLGVVPVIPADNVISDDLYTSAAMIADAAYLDRAVANYLSNMDAIIQDQTFSQLAMPAQGLMPGTSEEDQKLNKLIEMGTKRIFTYNGEGNAKPEYLSPDVKQAELILKVVNKVIAEIYHSTGLAGERTKDDNSQGIDNSSGVAKAYDFERVNSLLASKADALETFENKLAWMVARYQREEKQVEKVTGGLVSYPDNFDVRSLYDEFEIAAQLALVEAPDGTRKEQMKVVIDKLFPQLKSALIDKLKQEIDDSWPKDPVEFAHDMALAGAAGDMKIKESISSKSGLPQAKKDRKNSLANKLVK